MPAILAPAPSSRLDLISRVTDRLVRTLDFDQALRTLIEGATDLLEVERSSIMILDQRRKELTIRVAKGIDPEIVASTRIPLGRGIAGGVASSGEPVVVDDIRRLPAWRETVTGTQREDYRDFSALCVPLIIHGQVRGVMNFNHKKTKGSFGSSDLESAMLIANQAAIVLYCAQLHRAHLENEAMDHELRVARTIQERFLPTELPRLEGFSFAATCAMCSHVGGDYYDFVSLNDGRLMIAIGDVAGHGVGSALIMANARACLRGSIAAGDSIRGSLALLNDLLVADTEAQMFMTLLVGLLDPRSRSLKYLSAGHPMPLLLRGRRLVELPRLASNIPLGVEPDLSFVVEEPIRLETGDLLLLFTDGIFEARNPSDRRFGPGRIRQALLETSVRSPRAVIDEILARCEEHRSSAAAEDDCTLIALRAE